MTKRKENPTYGRTHGMTHTAEHNAWGNAKGRCYNPRNKRYQHYGSRGITVCERWLNSFENFFSDMGPRPPGYSLERIDNNGHYCPENCKWILRSDQGKNKRCIRLLTYQGKTQSMADWARELELTILLIWRRLNRGWSVEDALTKPKISNSEAGKKGAGSRWGHASKP